VEVVRRLLRLYSASLGDLGVELGWVRSLVVVAAGDQKVVEEWRTALLLGEVRYADEGSM
jgi:hypothetical protein